MRKQTTTFSAIKGLIESLVAYFAANKETHIFTFINNNRNFAYTEVCRIVKEIETLLDLNFYKRPPLYIKNTGEIVTYIETQLTQHEIAQLYKDYVKQEENNTPVPRNNTASDKRNSATSHTTHLDTSKWHSYETDELEAYVSYHDCW